MKEATDVNGKKVQKEIVYVMSGWSNHPNYRTKDEFAEALKEYGWVRKYPETVTRGVDYVISADTGTNKVRKARGYGIPVVPYDEVIDGLQMWEKWNLI